MLGNEGDSENRGGFFFNLGPTLSSLDADGTPRA